MPEAGVSTSHSSSHEPSRPVSDAVGRDHRGQEDARARLGHILRSWTLAALDRFDEALQLLDEEIIAAQQDRQNWALRVFETTKGRLALQMGDLAEAAVALENRFTVEEAHLVAGTLHAPAVVALGKLKIHLADQSGALEVAEIAKVMLHSDTPYVRYHAVVVLGAPFRSVSPTLWGPTCGLTAWVRTNASRCSRCFPTKSPTTQSESGIAAAVGDAELADKAVSLAQRRADQNPGVLSCQAAAAHCRGIWTESGDDLTLAASLYNDGKRPLAYASALEDLGRVLTQHGRQRPCGESLGDGPGGHDRRWGHVGLSPDPLAAATAGDPTTARDRRAPQDRSEVPDQN